MSSSLTPIITHAGITALIDARNNGATARITHVAVGDGGGSATGTPYTATADMTALRNEIQRVLVAGGERIGSLQNQLHLTATVQDEGTDVPDVYPIFEIGFFLATGELLALYASPDEKLAEKIAGTDFLLAFDLTFTGAEAGDIVVDGSGQLETPAARDNMLLGLNTVKIHTQTEFDRIFNQGEDTVIPANTTITLSPIQGADTDIANGASGGTGDNPENTYNGRPAYILKNSIVLSENVHIIGFNQEDTLVVKDAAETKIKLQGTAGAPVTGVRLQGWSFDGRGGVDGLRGNLTATTDGGAFFLGHCEQCDLNCKIINHHTSGDGGGLYGGDNVRYITATQVHHNRAANGGGAANCHSSTLNVYDCSATASGSGTFNCDNAMLRLFNCQANQGNGVFVNDNSDLTVSGNAVIGSAGEELTIGHVGHDNFAGIAHEECAGDRNRYALIQSRSGVTFLNTTPNRNLHLRQGNQDRMVIGTDGNVGIGTDAPTAKLDVSGDTNVSGDTHIGGNLGIGTDEPTETLHVNGDYYGRGHVWFYANGGDGNDGTAFIQARDKSGSSSIGLQLRTQENGTVRDRVYLDPAGNVGIGTTSPGQKLHVEGNAVVGSAGEELRIGDVGHGNFAGIAHEGSTGPGEYALIQNAGGTTLLNSASGQRLHLRQGNSDRIVVETDGDVTFTGKIKADAVPMGIGAMISNHGSNQIAVYERFVCHSMANYAQYGINDMDDGYMVMPGYRVDIFSATSHTGARATLDNTNGTKPRFFKLRNRVNQTSSCRLFYDNSEITEPSVTFVDDY